MTTASEQFVVDLPVAMKDALGAFAAEHRMPMTEVARYAIAAHIGYEYGGIERASWSRVKLEIPQSERAALKRWGHSASSRMLDRGNIEAAQLIARAVVANDYDTLQALKAASEAVHVPAAESTDQPAADDNE